MNSHLRNPVFVRCDGGAEIGFGHVRRCLALAQGLKDTGFTDITFFTRYQDGVAERIIRDGGFNVRTIPSELSMEEEISLLTEFLQPCLPCLLITDSYSINSDYLKQMRESSVIILTIDDMGENFIHSHFLLNQNIGAENMVHRTDPETIEMLGTKYVLLNREFIQAMDFHRSTPEVASRVMVTLGGSDPEDQTAKVVAALDMVSFPMEITVIAGGSYRGYPGLLRRSQVATRNIKILSNVSNIAELMQNSDLAITAGGSTCYEAAAMQLPNIILVTEDNQRNIARGMHEYGCSVSLEWYQQVSEDKIASTVEYLAHDSQQRRYMSQRGRELIDGRGCQRVIGIIERNLGNFK